MARREKPTATAEDLAIWREGARTVKQARAEFGLSNDVLWAGMADGTFRWCQHGGRGTRLIAYGDLVRYVAQLYVDTHAAGAGAGT